MSFFDYAVDGVLLRGVMKALNIGVLSNEWDSDFFVRKMLLDEPPSEELRGRVQLYGCEICLDIACGGIAASITKSDGRIVWSDIARFETDYAGDCEIVFYGLDAGPYAFDVEQYRSTLNTVLGK